MFSGASNLRSLQVIYLKFILVYIIHKNFKNDRTKDNGYTDHITGYTKMEKNIKKISNKISAVCVSLLCYSTMSKLHHLLSGILTITY